MLSPFAYNNVLQSVLSENPPNNYKVAQPSQAYSPYLITFNHVEVNDYVYVPNVSL